MIWGHMQGNIFWYMSRGMQGLRQLVTDVYSCFKYAYQRACRGWDDTSVWSVDIYLADIIPPMLRSLRDRKAGIPGFAFDDLMKDKHTKEDWKRAQERWNQWLDEVIEGFEAAKDIQGCKCEGYSDALVRFEKLYPGESIFVDRKLSEEEKEHLLKNFNLTEAEPSEPVVKTHFHPGYQRIEEELKTLEKVEEEDKIAIKVFDKGMKRFHEIFFSLWY